MLAIRLERLGRLGFAHSAGLDLLRPTAGSILSFELWTAPIVAKRLAEPAQMPAAVGYLVGGFHQQLTLAGEGAPMLC